MSPKLINFFGKAFSRVMRFSPKGEVLATHVADKCSFFSNQTRPQTSTTTSLAPALSKKAMYFNIPADAWEKTGFVFHQHFLDSFRTDLLEELLRLGVPPKNIVTAKKPYSECKHVTEEIKALDVEVIPDAEQLVYGGYSYAVYQVMSELWRTAAKQFNNESVKQILLVDDGFSATSAVPSTMLNRPFVSVEQTSSGTTPPQSEVMPFPIVSFANTAVKKHLETEVIIGEILACLKNNPKFTLPRGAVCGVVGQGPIGKWLGIALAQEGYKVLVYDKDPRKTAQVKNGIFAVKRLNSLITSVDFMFGCSGFDITESLEEFDDATRNVTMLNFASSDKEFRCMLAKAQKQKNGHKNGKNGKKIDPFATLEYHNRNGARFLLPNGGFVANFNRECEIAPREQILITRESLMDCICQGMLFLNNTKVLENPQRYMIHPRIQQLRAIDWLQKQPDTPYHREMLKAFSDLNWIRKESDWADPTDLISLDEITQPQKDSTTLKF